MPVMKTRATTMDSHNGTVMSRAGSVDQAPTGGGQGPTEGVRAFRSRSSIGSTKSGAAHNPLDEASNVRFQSNGGTAMARFSSTEMGGDDEYAGGGARLEGGVDHVAASVATSSFSNSAKVRLGLLGIVAKESHPAAIRIVRALWVLCVAAFLVAVSQMIIVQSTLESSQRRIGTVLTNQLRADLVSHAGVTVQSVIVSLETGQTILTPAQGAAVLLQVADDLEEATNRITRDFEILSADETTRLESSKVTVGEISPVGTLMRLELSLTDACLWYVSHLRRAAPQIAAFNLQHPSVFTVLQAGQLVLRPSLASSGSDRTALYSDFVVKQQQERVVEFSVVFSVLVWITAAFVVWQMYKLDAHRQRILGVMKFVPRAQASGMKHLTSSNLLRRANNVNADGTNDNEFANELDDSSPSNAPTGLAPSDGTKPTTRVKGRKWITGLRFKVSNGMLLCTPVLIVGAMLLSVFFTRESFRVQSEQAAQTALYAHELRNDMFLFATFTSGIASPSIVRQLAATTSYESLKRQFDDVRSELISVLDEIVKGSDDGPLSGVTTGPLKKDLAFSNLILKDACADFTPYVAGFGSQAECTLRSNGVLSEAGLQGGLLELVTVGGRGYNVFVERARPNTTLSPATLASATADVVESSRLVLPYVSSIARSASILKNEELLQLSEQESQVLIACYCMFVLLLWGTVGCYFVPKARALGQHVTAAQVVLPMLPPAWTESIPELRSRVEAATNAIILGTPDRAAAKRGRLVQALSGSV